MIKRMMATWALAALLLMGNAFAGSGELFNVSATGTPGNVNITLCLNGKGPLSCQNYTVSALNLTISPAISDHVYSFIGIKINTPGYTLGNLGLDCTPTSNGYCLFSASQSQAKTVSLVVNGALTLSPTTLPITTTSSAYSQTITASGGISPYLYAVTAGALPPGLLLSTEGLISGTATQDGTYSFTIKATDSNTPSNIIGSQAYTLQVFSGNTTTTLSSSLNPNSYNQSVTFTAAVSPGNATGTVTFTDGGNIIGSGTLSSGVAMYTTSSFTAGTHNLVATYAGDSNFDGSMSNTVSQVVNIATQTITYTSTAPSATVGGATYTPTATSTSGLAVTITVDAASSSICSISGGVVSFTAAGTCRLDANQAGNSNYNAATPVQQVVTVGASSQTITYTSTAPSATVGGATYTPTATSTSGLAVTITVDAASSSICSISGGVVSFTAAGTCRLNANQAGNSNYNAATPVQQVVTVGASSQTITYTSTAPSAIVGGATYTPTATSTSGLAVTITVDAASSSICSISGGVVSFTAAGTCRLNANQAGNSNYNAATPVQQVVTVGAGSQTITYTSTAPSATVGGATYTPTATSTSGLAVTITVDVASSSICSISGGVVSFTAAGTCRLDANQAGNSNYNAATPVQQVVTVGASSQTITYTSTAPSATVGGATYTPTATSTSGLAVTITVDAASSSICSISGGVVSFTAAGTCRLNANQAGNSNYNAATQVQQVVTVSAPTPTTTVVYSSLNPSAASVPVTFSANVNSYNGIPSAGTVSFTANGTSISGCTARSLSSGIATCTTSSLSMGTDVIVATYTGGSNFAASTSSSFSQSVVATVTATVPAAPQYVTAVPNNGQVSVSWYPPANTGGATITGYTVKYGITSNATYTTAGCTTSSASGLSCTVSSGLSNGTPYTFTVVASNANGTGPAAFSSSVIPKSTLIANPANLALSGLGSGASRTIIITNNSGTEVTNISIGYPSSPTYTSATSTCTSTLAAGANCSISVTPGATATSNCITGIAPTPDVITITSSVTTLTANVVVLRYGCQYQKGYLFSIDDTTPSTSSIGGKVVTLSDQSSFISWSSDYVSIWGIDDTSTIGSPSPNTSSGSPATLTAGQLNCNAVNDGACATHNVFILYGMASNAVSLCKATINGYTDWYLPSVCEMGPFNTGGNYPGITGPPASKTCTTGSTNIQNQLVTTNIVSNFNASYYWSSTEFSTFPLFFAWMQAFMSSFSYQMEDDKFSASYGVRCSRALTL